MSTVNQKFAQLQPFIVAGSGPAIGDTTLLLESFTDIDGNALTMSNFGTLGYGTIEPGALMQEEQLSFTGITQNPDGTTQLTGISSVGFLYPYTPTSGFVKSHVGGTTFVISNTSAFYAALASTADDETITGTYTFTSPNVPRMDTDYAYGPTDGTLLTTKDYVDDVAVAGAPNAGPSTKGIVQMASATQVGAGTATGSTGALLVAPNSLFNQTSSAAVIVPVTNSSGKLPAGFGGAASSLATLDSSSLVVQNPTNASATPGANKIPIANSSGQLNTGWVSDSFGGTGTDGALSGTTAINLGSAPVVIKNYSSISLTGTDALTFTNPYSGGTIVILKSQGNVTITTSATPGINLRGLGGGTSNNLYAAGGGGAATYLPSTNGTPGTLVVSGSRYVIAGKNQILMTGGNGGGGFNGSGISGGGAGAGALYIECGGALNFTGSINANGSNGSGTTNGGGGGAGCVAICYNSLTANSGTITTTGGSGGAGQGASVYGGGGAGFANNATATTGGGAGSAGYSSVYQNTEFI